MRYLRRAWRLWSDILTFDWLERLSRHHPDVAYAIGSIIWSVGMGIAAWVHLDPRIRLYEKNSYIEQAWPGRIVMGVILLGLAIAPVILSIAFRGRNAIELGWPRFGRQTTKRKK